MSKIYAILLFSSCTFLSCGKEGPLSNPIPYVSPTSPEITKLAPLIKEGKVKITRDGSLEIISVFGPNQYQTTGTYDCWIHAPFNAWRLFEGDSIESFAGMDWEKNLVEEIKKFKKEAGISESHLGGVGTCLSQSQILRPMADSQDFDQINIMGAFLRSESTTSAFNFPIDPSLIATLSHITKGEYEYYSSDDDGKKEITSFEKYYQNCNKALIPFKDYFDLIKQRGTCIDALIEKIKKNVNIDNRLTTLVDDYLLGKSPSSVISSINYFYYNKIIQSFGDKIKRLRQDHSQILILKFQKSPVEYPLEHAVAAKVMSPKAYKIIVVNSENRHLEANKTIKMLHQIFNLPLPEELK